MFLLLLLMLIQPVQAQAKSLRTDPALVCMEATQKIEQEYNIKQHLLTTISNVESGRWNQARKQKLAWPWTVNAQGKGRYYASKAEAVREVKRLQKAGVKSIDVGCMQINLAYHPKAFKSIEEAFDPVKNLYENKDNDWIKAAMAYHSSIPHKGQRYKKRLVNAFESIRQARLIDGKARLFGSPAQSANKKLDKNTVYAKNKQKIEQTVAAKANAWREAKLDEYRRSKLK